MCAPRIVELESVTIDHPISDAQAVCDSALLTVNVDLSNPEVAFLESRVADMRQPLQASRYDLRNENDPIQTPTNRIVLIKYDTPIERQVTFEVFATDKAFNRLGQIDSKYVVLDCEETS